MSSPTLNQFVAATIARLKPAIGEREARASLRLIFETVKGWSPVDIAVKGAEPISPFVAGKVDDIVNRMLAHEPVQYILGETLWYGLKLRVSPAVLIPRPETAELVDMIVKEAGSTADLRVADICTGSGCIAVALARNLTFPVITAIDISAPALEIAAENIKDLKVSSVTLLKADATDPSELPGGEFDIIVANPPYIADDERGSMDRNVLLYEPHSTLFVPDDDPLLFYRAIAGYARTHLSASGRLYFEINPIYAERLAAHMTDAGWRDVTLTRDIHGTYRFLSASRPE